MSREAVWQAQHDATCDEMPPHEWTEHLPWDSDEARESAEREADAIIAALAHDTFERTPFQRHPPVRDICVATIAHKCGADPYALLAALSSQEPVT